MSDTKGSALVLLSSGFANGDLFNFIDVSDTTMGVAGSNKRVTFVTLAAELLAAAGIAVGSPTSPGSFSTLSAAGVVNLSPASGNVTLSPGAGNLILSTTGSAPITITSGGPGVLTNFKLNKVTVTAPATGATLTLADNSSLVTVGGYSVTLTATGGTALTLPTSGTIATIPTAAALAYSATLAPALASNGLRTIINVGTLTGNVTAVSAPTGTPVDGQMLEFRLLQDATGGRTITGWDSIYDPSSSQLLTDTNDATHSTASKRYTVLFEYLAASSKYHLRAVSGTHS